MSLPRTQPRVKIPPAPPQSTTPRRRRGSPTGPAMITRGCPSHPAATSRWMWRPSRRKRITRKSPRRQRTRASSSLACSRSRNALTTCSTTPIRTPLGRTRRMCANKMKTCSTGSTSLKMIRHSPPRRTRRRTPPMPRRPHRRRSRRRREVKRRTNPSGSHGSSWLRSSACSRRACSSGPAYRWTQRRERSTMKTTGWTWRR
mmetsp:Transcript_453/g.1125  ORF Transcript_453/g.1125 Transcript_453/m.1125 type:complete len:202 (-) Transcript_453:1144-1749(-)